MNRSTNRRTNPHIDLGLKRGSEQCQPGELGKLECPIRSQIKTRLMKRDAFLLSRPTPLGSRKSGKKSVQEKVTAFSRSNASRRFKEVEHKRQEPPREARSPHLVSSREARQRLSRLSSVLHIPLAALRRRLGPSPRIYDLPKNSILQIFEKLRSNTKWPLLNRLLDESQQQINGDEGEQQGGKEEEAKLKMLERIGGTDLACAWLVHQWFLEEETCESPTPEYIDMPADLLKIQDKLATALHRLSPNRINL